MLRHTRRFYPTGSVLPTVWTADGHAVNGAPTRTFLGSGDWIALDRTGDASNSEQQGYSPGNIFVNGSNFLEIKAEKASSHGQAYRSGMIQWTNLQMIHGTLEVRMQIAAGTGPWPAFWMLGIGLQQQNISTAADSPTAHWPIVSELADELDIVEMLGSGRTNVNCQIHADFGSGTVNDGPGTVALGFDASAAFHTYQLIRAAGSLTWKADGATLGTLTGAHVSDTPMFNIINIAVGGTGGGTIVDGTLPVSTLVDYVKLVPA